jgi:hypothetical protein
MRCRTPVRSCPRGQRRGQVRLGTPVTRKNAPLSVGELLPCGRCAALQVAWLQRWLPAAGQHGGVARRGSRAGIPGNVGCAARGKSAPRRAGAELPARVAAPRCASRTASRGWDGRHGARAARAAGAPGVCADIWVAAHDGVGARAGSVGGRVVGTACQPGCQLGALVARQRAGSSASRAAAKPGRALATYPQRKSAG